MSNVFSSPFFWVGVGLIFVGVIVVMSVMKRRAQEVADLDQIFHTQPLNLEEIRKEELRRARKKGSRSTTKSEGESVDVNVTEQRRLYKRSLLNPTSPHTDLENTASYSLLDLHVQDMKKELTGEEVDASSTDTPSTDTDSAR